MSRRTFFKGVGALSFGTLISAGVEAKTSGYSKDLRKTVKRDVLVPRKFDGLLVTGRCISGSHNTQASYRVQIIALASGNGIQPREVGVKKI